MLGVIKGVLRLALLGVLVVLGLQASYLFVQVGELLRRLEAEAMGTNRQVQETLLYSQAVLSSLRSTTEIVRKSAEHQMGYYEAVGRRSSRVLGELAILVKHADERMERLTRAAELTALGSAAAADEVGMHIHELGGQATTLLATATATVGALETTARSERIPQSLEHLEASTRNVEGATRNVEEATGYIRDMLSPTKKSFWRRLLELMIPRPSVNVR